MDFKRKFWSVCYLNCCVLSFCQNFPDPWPSLIVAPKGLYDVSLNVIFKEFRKRFSQVSPNRILCLSWHHQGLDVAARGEWGGQQVCRVSLPAGGQGEYRQTPHIRHHRLRSGHRLIFKKSVENSRTGSFSTIKKARYILDIELGIFTGLWISH